MSRENTYYRFHLRQTLPAGALTSPHAYYNFIIDGHQHASAAGSTQPQPCCSHVVCFGFHISWMHMLTECCKVLLTVRVTSGQ